MKLRMTQSELKRQKDLLRQYERYLPTLQLKKQLVQLEILHQEGLLRERQETLSRKMEQAKLWAGVLAEVPGIRQWLLPARVITEAKNVAGIDLPVFVRAEFGPAVYDLFLAPLWLDRGLEALREMVSLREEVRVLGEGIAILRQELRITTQRVNLFEKVKIPETREAIRLIRIALADRMTTAIGRSKIAKKKLQEAEGGGMPA